MAYQAENIINIVTYLTSSGLGTANFGAGMIFADSDSSTDVLFVGNTYRDYGSAAEVAEDFAETSDPYLAALAWFSAIPKPISLRIYLRASGQTPVQSFNAAINNNVWFYWFDFETGLRATDADVLAIQAAADANDKFFAFTSNDADVRDGSSTDSIAKKMLTAGSRRAFVLNHATSPYAGFELAAVFSRVNFSAANSTITGELKKLPGVPAEDLSKTAYSAMKANGAVFYTVVETGGQQDNGRIINAKSTSTFGEFIDDVFNLDAFVNYLTVELYNALAGTPTKLAQTPAGQAVLNNAAGQVCERFISNGFLGERQYVDDETGETKLSRGYLILTKASDILSISSADRAARKAAPIRIRVFRAGAIHSADVAIYVE